MHIDDGQVTIIKEAQPVVSENAFEFNHEFNVIANTLRAYADNIEKLEDLTNDIDDPEIQSRANQIKSQLLAVLNEMDGGSLKQMENLLISLDRVQAMWWNSRGHETEFVMGDIHEMQGGEMPDVSG
jgi:hypothetical protein